MKIKTIRGALRAVRRKVSAVRREDIQSSRQLDKDYGLLASGHVWYITRLLSQADFVDFGALFPELAHQIGWTRGIRLSRNELAAAMSATRKPGESGIVTSTLVLVDTDGRLLQIGPATLVGFCDYLGLVSGRGDAYVVFPTIILSPAFGSSRTPEESTALQRASLVSQVNSVEADDEGRQQYFADAVLQLGKTGTAQDGTGSAAPSASFDQIDFSGEGSVLALLSEINRSLSQIRELLEKELPK
jgi:hypothetical protein